MDTVHQPPDNPPDPQAATPYFPRRAVFAAEVGPRSPAAPGRMTGPGARSSSPGRAPGMGPRGRRGTARHEGGVMPRDLPGILIVAGMAVATAAFAFCVVASAAYGWHRSVTGPGIAVSFAAMAACVAAAHLRGDGE